jgi:hypothetical protein
MKGASGFGRSRIMRVYALRHHKPRSPDGVRLWSQSDGHVDRELSSGGLAYERSVGIWTIGNHAGVCIEASQTP